MLNYISPPPHTKKDEVLIPGTCEYELIWKVFFCKVFFFANDQVAMKSVGQALIKYDHVLMKGENTDTYLHSKKTT